MSDAPTRVGARKALRRTAFVALALPIALAVAACAGAGSSSSAGASASPSAAVSESPSGGVAGATGSPSASVAASPTAEDACSLITTDEAAQLVGSPVMATPASTPAGPTCRYTPTEAGKQGFLTVSVFTGDIDKTLSDAVENFGLGDVTDVGSKAAGVDGTIYVSTGTVAFAIVAANGTFQPIPLTDLTALAKTVVERLGGTNASAAPSASESGSPSASDAGASGSASPSPSSS
jgi:hypothetical protein